MGNLNASVELDFGNQNKFGNVSFIMNLHMNKIIPYDYIEKLSVHHMSNKYRLYGLPPEDIDEIVEKWESKQ